MIAFQHLKKHFILLDHAQLAARPLLNCAVTLLQVTYLGIKGGVACLQALIDLLLRCNFLIHFPYAQPTPLPQPKRILQRGDDKHQIAASASAWEKLRTPGQRLIW